MTINANTPPPPYNPPEEVPPHWRYRDSKKLDQIATWLMILTVIAALLLLLQVFSLVWAGQAVDRAHRQLDQIHRDHKAVVVVPRTHPTPKPQSQGEGQPHTEVPSTG